MQDRSSFRTGRHSGQIAMQYMSSYRTGRHAGQVVVQDRSSYRTCRHAGQVVIQNMSLCRTDRHAGHVVIQDRSSCMTYCHAGQVVIVPVLLAYKVDFSIFLFESVRNRSLTQLLKPFGFGFVICGGIRYRKLTAGVVDSLFR
jgi:hypothetical protein